MQGLVPHGNGARRIVCSSALVGKRQSQWLLKPPVIVLPSALTQLPTPVAPPFSVLRKLVNAVPSGAVELPELLQLNPSLAQWGPGQVLSFFSQVSPVWLSVTG